MKKTERRKKLGIHAVSLAVLAALVLAIVLVPLEAGAVTSLSGIEQIKSRGGTFTILEIVPEAGTGSIGYYVSGQEPTASWMGALMEKTSRNERTNYANALFNNLIARNIMGAVGTAPDAYPLTQTSNYQEAYPWENIPEGSVKLSLGTEESVTVNGEFVAAAGGSYEQTDAYEYELGGSYVENADYYVYGTSGETDTYYYALTFQLAPVDESNVDSFFGVPLYTYAPEAETGAAHYTYAGTLVENSSDFTIDLNTTYYTASVVPNSYLTNTWESFEQVTVADDGSFNAADGTKLDNGTTLYTRTGDTASYQAAGIVGDAEFVPVEGTVYYKASDGATPVTTGTEPVETVLHSYYARKNSTIPYREKTENETGYFKQITGYRYVGDGNGSLDFVPNTTGSTAQTVVTDTIYVSGGYVNNNWFKKYVLDMEDDELANVRVEVKSCTPDTITDDLINIANLVVVSAGFDLSSGNTVPYTRDITAEQKAALNDKPRVVDARISGAPNLASLGEQEETPPCVTANNVYYFTTGTGSDARPALATNLFHEKFENTSPYQVVLDEITYENQLREVAGETKLSTDISMAACIRYIINTHRAVNKKTAIKVLDIEPAPIYDQTDNNGPLTVETVRSWLPASANNPNSEEYIKTIEITHMSTAALIGKIEDINEEYDLIYIGASLKGLNTTWSNGAQIVNYNDNSMDGLIYTNIGDTFSADTVLEGLLETDYQQDRWGNVQGASNATTYRFSGNDITPKKQTELVEFANAGLPIVVADDLTLKTAGQPERTLSVSITTGNVNENSVMLTAKPTVTPDGGNLTYEYQWYKVNGGYNEKVGTQQTLEAEAGYQGYQYYCEVTVTSAGLRYTARSETVSVKRGSPTWTKTKGGTNNNGYSVNITPDGYTLTATLSGDTRGRTVTYQWYKDGRETGTNQNFYTVTDTSGSHEYYCEVTIGSGRNRVTVTSPTYKLTQNVTTDTVANGKPVTIQEVSGSDGLNTARIDKCSLLYAALDSVWDKDNVLSEGELTSGTAMSDMQNTLVKHLNLSRPEIVLSAQPTEYSGDLTTNTCDGTLSFTFTITNPTDATPSETKYYCRLYIDQNGDGRHTDNEEVSDLWISGGTENGQLSAGIEYKVERVLSSKQFSGIVPWKLQVVKVGDDTVHASEKGYTYIQPASPTPIKILQVRDIGLNLATEENFKVGNRTVRNDSERTRDGVVLNLYKELKEQGAFDLNVFSMTVGELNNYAATQDGIYEYLNSFDMLIIGFGDCYGDFDEKTANAVVQYIDTGKAILFTHDTTSFRNLPKNISYQGSSYNGSMTYWGYYFNTILRDKVGLDRYGVTNTIYGLNKYSSSKTQSGPVANEYAGAVLESIKNAGYSIAYKPGSEFSTVGETQGYTNYTLARFRKGSDLLPTTGYGSYPSGGNGMTTNTVSQVNQGQITQFPYKLEETLTVATTHEQYYQLNMNSDDIVVWYCLAGDNFASGKNDVTNGYYIYNRGNVTYSGAGHFAYDTDTLGANEAKLFINTMVAAYRAGNGSPTVSYRTADDFSDLSVQLIPMEYEEGGTGSSLGGNQTVYFKITDPNLTTEKTMKVEFFYEVSDGEEETSLQDPVSGDSPVVKQAACETIYRASDGAEVTGSLQGNVLYKTDIPSEVLSAFAASGDSELKLYIRATTTISGTDYTGYDVLTLKKLGLLRLE
ncbi:MAG: DUF5057 domain-containing protein [Oscillospiraceae bacterium]